MQRASLPKSEMHPQHPARSPESYSPSLEVQVAPRRGGSRRGSKDGGDGAISKLDRIAAAKTTLMPSANSSPSVSPSLTPQAAPPMGPSEVFPKRSGEVNHTIRVCIDWIDQHGLEEVGVWRLTGSSKAIDELEKRLEEEDNA